MDKLCDNVKVIKTLRKHYKLVAVRNMHFIIGGICLFFGSIYAVATPPLWGLDEVAHANRVLDIARGNIIPPINERGSRGGSIPSSLVELNYYVYADLLDDIDTGAITSRKDVSDFKVYKILAGRSLKGAVEPTLITTTYSPVAYIGPIIGFALGDKANMSIWATIIVGRILGLLTYVALISLSLFLLRNYRMKWMIAIIALMPVSVYQASTISADTLTNALSILLFALVLRVLLDTSSNLVVPRKLIYSCFLVATILPFIKPNNILVAALILLIPNQFAASSKIRAVLIKLSVLITSIVGSVMWTRLVMSGVEPVSMRADQAPIDPGQQLQFMISHPLELLVTLGKTLIVNCNNYIETLMGTIGWNLSPLPIIFIIAIFIVVALAGTACKDELKLLKNSTWVFIAIVSLGIIASYIIIMYLTFNPVGHRLIEGVNGRYFIPSFLMLALFVARFALPGVRISERIVSSYVYVVAVASLLGSVAMYYIVTY